MPRFVFSGLDDDTAVVDTADDFGTVRDQFDAYHGARFHIAAADGAIRVRLDHDDDTGCWSVSFGPTSPVSSLPCWPVRVRPGRDGYTPMVTVTAPHDAVLHEIAA